MKAWQCRECLIVILDAGNCVDSPYGLERSDCPMCDASDWTTIEVSTVPMAARRAMVSLRVEMPPPDVVG